jgi:hypothetical protein
VTRTYSLAEVAAMVLPPEWDGERWLARRLARGEIRGYRLCVKGHPAWRMTEDHIQDFITRHENVTGAAVESPSPAPPAAPVTPNDILTPRGRRLRSAS